MILSNIDSLDERTLDLLAWQTHADFYDLAATPRMKREAVKNSLLLHMKKGTVWAIKEALRQLDIEAEFVPWWENGGEPYTFSLRAIVGGEFYRTSGRDALIANIYRAVEESKSASSRLTELHTEIHDTQSLQLYAAVIPFISGEIRIHLEAPPLPDGSKIYAGIATLQEGHCVIGIHRDTRQCMNVFAGVMAIRNFGVEIGVDLYTMQELLLRFEQRIFARLDEYEQRMTKHITDTLEEMSSNITERLEHVEKLLQWSGDDEEL